MQTAVKIAEIETVKRQSGRYDETIFHRIQNPAT